MQKPCIETGFYLSGLFAEGYSKGLTLVRVAAPCFPSLSQIPLAAC